MKNILSKIKLIDHLTTNLQITRQEFVDKLLFITEEENINIFSEIFGGFSSSPLEFKGQVTFDLFKIKRLKRFHQTGNNLAIASGTMIEKDGQLIIETEINGFPSLIIPYCILIVFFSIPSIAFLISEYKFDFFHFSIILIFAITMFFLLYRNVRGSVKRLKYELEREFFYLTKKK